MLAPSVYASSCLMPLAYFAQQGQTKQVEFFLELKEAKCVFFVGVFFVFQTIAASFSHRVEGYLL